MSKKIYVLRHAKAEEPAQGTDDFSRKLSSKGKKQCEKICKYMQKNKIKPDLVLCSPSKRTRQTFDGLQKVLKDATVVYDEKIYEANPKVLLKLLQYIDDGYKSVVLIGHNPSVMTLCAAIADTKSSNVKDLKAMLNKFPTGAMACFKAKAKSWQDIKVDKLKLETFIIPKKI